LRETNARDYPASVIDRLVLTLPKGVASTFKVLVLWLRRNMPESTRWEEANERRRMAHAQQQSGATLDGVDAALTRSTVVDMFTDPMIRRRLVPAFLMMLSVTFGFWGVATFVPTYVGTVATKMQLSAPFYSAIAGLVATGFGISGFITLGFLADGIGRKPTAMLYYAMSLILTPVLYLWAQDMGTLLVAVAVFGFFTTGIWSWAPIWLPELFPTRVRAMAFSRATRLRPTRIPLAVNSAWMRGAP
jgi:hypothetical protein